MKYLLVIIGLLFSVGFAQAQDNNPGWTVEERCVTLQYPVISQGQWDFPGVLVTVDSQGVRALRGQLAYFLALTSADTFPARGSVSPDYRYFAYPVGHTTQNSSLTSRLVVVDGLRVIRLDGDTSETYLRETKYSTLTNSPEETLPNVNWIDSEHLFFEGQGVPSVINPFTGEQSEWIDIFKPDSVSPDSTRAFYFDSDTSSHVLYNLQQDQPLSNLQIDNGVWWFPDSSRFITDLQTQPGLVLYDRNGNFTDRISEINTYEVGAAPNSRYIAYLTDEGYFVADLEAQINYSLCLAPSYADWRSPLLAWSPDSRTLALTYDGYLVLVDIQSLYNRILNYQADGLMGWYPLPGEEYTMYTGGFAVAIASSPQISLSADPLQAFPTNSPMLPTLTPTSLNDPFFVPSATPRNPTLLPSPTPGPVASTCTLEVLSGANLRSGPGVDFEKVGSAAAGFVLEANAQQFNSTEFFTWWRLNTGEWIREDFVSEDANCAALPVLGS